MKNYGLKITGTRIQETKDGKKMTIVETMTADRPRLCKQCGKYPRNQGSSRCEGCVQDYRKQEFESNRLRKKVEEATKIKN